MADRLDLQAQLEGILESRNVYFQPPASVQMQYPAIKYSLKDVIVRHANNLSYMMHSGYELILIDKNPDSQYVKKLLELPYCSFDRSYYADNLNHFVFTVY